MTRADKRHLADDRLLDLFFGTDREAQAADAAALRHLDACEACAARYGELAGSLEQVRTEARAEADAIFDDKRLEHQRAHVLQRLEHAGRPARVIPFPASAGRGYPAVRPAATRRWIAAAAIAGLFVGLTAGWFADVQQERWLRGVPAPTTTARNQAPPAPAAAREVGTVPAVSDEEFLSDIEAAIFQHRMSGLEAVDALTPRFREARLTIR